MNNDVIDCGYESAYTYVNDDLTTIETAALTSSYDYNIKNFISVLENTLNNASLVYEYAYDENGNIITETIITKDKNGNITNNEPTRED